jgi:signal transduction histidine kinase/CheY-like chemotaxis protein
MALVRLWIARHFAAIYARSPTTWRRLFVAAILATIIPWGLGCAYFVSILHDDALLFLLPTAGLCAGAMPSLSPMPRLYPVFLVAMLGPTIVAEAGSEQLHAMGISLNLVLYVLTMVFIGGKVQADFWRSLRSERLLEERAIELEQARADVAAASRAKGEFLAVVGHEIRTPMNGVLGMVELLQDMDLAPDARRFVNAIATSGDALLSLITDLLDFEKMDAGKLEVETVTFDLHGCVADVVVLFGPRASQKELELAWTADAGVARRVRGDPLRLRQVLSNLVGNAIKFTDAGSIRVRLARGESADGNHAVRFEVTDTGVGISPESRARLFRPYEQADVSTARRHGGTGLGLAISERLVRLMGGSLTVESEVGQGSTFSFVLPLGLAPSSMHFEASSQVLRVLLVEDNAIHRFMAAGMLEKLGCRVDVAPTGAEALTMVEQTSYDAVFWDWSLADMDGLEAVRALRHRGHVSAPIVGITGEGDDPARILEAGMDDHVAKPLRALSLSEVLTRIRVAEAP